MPIGKDYFWPASIPSRSMVSFASYVLAALLTGCAAGGSGSSPTPAVPLGVQVTAGTPAPSRPADRWITALGDSITAGTGTSSPPDTSYANRAFAALGVSGSNFGANGAQAADIIPRVAMVPAQTTTVLLYIGTNDVKAAAQVTVDPLVAVANTKTLEPGFDALLGAISAQVPAARVAIVTVRDLGRAGVALPDCCNTASATAAAHEWDTHERAVAAPLGLAVVDLEFGAEWYRLDEYDAYRIHPNDAGAQHLANAVASALR